MKRRGKGLSLVWAIIFGVGLLAVTFAPPGSAARLIFGKGEFHPTQGTFWLFWGAAVFAIIAVGLLAFATDLLEQEHAAHTPVAKSADPTSAKTPKEQRIEEYVGRGYAVEEELTFKPAPNEPTTSIALPLRGTLVTEPADVDREGVWSRQGAIVYDNAVVTDFRVTVIYDAESWQRGDAEHFEQRRAGRPVHIRNALKQQYIADTTADKDWVVCYGLSSSDSSDASGNDELADDRAANLCKALVNLGYVKEGRAMGVGLGYARVSVPTPQQLSRQRAAVLVGLKVIQTIRVSDLTTGVAKVIQIQGINLDNYSRSHDGATIIRGISKGDYTGAREIPLNAGTDDSFNKIEKPRD